MKTVLSLLFSLSLFAFEGNKLYQCVPKYRIVDGTPHEFSIEEQKKNAFTLVFNQKRSRVKTSNGIIYAAAESNLKGKSYYHKKKVNGRTLSYKLKQASENGLYRSVYVTGYGNLINEYVLCAQLPSKKKNSQNNK